MTYKETIEFLFSSLPMYQRVGDVAIKKDLTNIRKLCTILGDPHHSFSTIHVAGTNGKGSTSHMLASVFQSAGFKTGLYTSPHYVDFRERIKVNGEMISEGHVTEFVEKYKSGWESIQPSFFEITVAMAFDYFRNENIDIAIIETGLGGRLDSTNIITPLLSVITNIGYDHMQMLGNTLPEIAFEKAGIIKNNVPVVIGEFQNETADVFIDKAHQESAPITFASKELSIVEEQTGFKLNSYNIRSALNEINEWFETDLTGPYQSKNIITAIQSCIIWNGFYPSKSISLQSIHDGLKKVKTTTNMIGRWMILHERPLVITDAAHNLDGIKSIINRLNEIDAITKHFVLGFVSDKEIGKILSLFPADGKFYWCKPDIPRGKDQLETMQEGLKIGLDGKAFDSVLEAYRNAFSHAKANDLIFVGGSSYVVGDFLAGN
jgi:dihydrofolate synthase / folylpolyglutamate synthase